MLLPIFKHALMITSFVFIMMLLIEYINVQTRGNWQVNLQKHRWGQYLLGAFMGALPGCLGAFTVVSLYTHNILSLGALVAAMVATSGDEAFVMFSMFPLKALWITLALLGIALITGPMVDALPIRKWFAIQGPDHVLQVHQADLCHCFPGKEVLAQLRRPSFPRTLLLLMLGLFLFFLLTGSLGSANWDWKKITFLFSVLLGLFIVGTVPDHFLEAHLWEHVLKKHLLRIFLWTFAALLVIHFIKSHLNLAAWISGNYLLVLVLAVVIGMIPESGPHMIFVTLFAQGTLPLAILMASSVVQDGHGMLPLLATSKRSFIAVKLINMFVGFSLGLVGLIFV